ncbi:MAG: hypothetical protein EBT04_06410 [Betaproteobacteria bacterium]|nr:hypothetical protein [Betaproteobacteria bacterium]
MFTPSEPCRLGLFPFDRGADDRCVKHPPGGVFGYRVAWPVQQGTLNLTRSQNSIKTDQSRDEANLLIDDL